MTSADLSHAEVLTVEEAATLLRISRNAAYSLARQWRATGGQSGLPCFELGRCIRVPRSALEQMLDPSAASGPPTATTPLDVAESPTTT